VETKDDDGGVGVGGDVTGEIKPHNLQHDKSCPVCDEGASF